MVQREVADRFFASPSTKAYGAVSVLVAARHRSHRLPSRLARGLPPAAERRLRARRVPARRARRPRRREAHRRGRLRAPPQDARQLARARRASHRARSAAAALEAIGRDPAARAEALAPAEFVALARALRVTTASRAREDQPRAGRRPPRRRRLPRGRDRAPAHRSLRRDLARAGRRARRRRASPRTRSSTRALESLAAAAGVEPRWHARIEKRIPVAAGLGGGSSDAATALLLANATLDAPLPAAGSTRIARALGADVPFFLDPGPEARHRRRLDARAAVDLPQDYAVVLLLPDGAEKESTARRLRPLRRSGRLRRTPRPHCSRSPADASTAADLAAASAERPRNLAARGRAARRRCLPRRRQRRRPEPCTACSPTARRPNAPPPLLGSLGRVWAPIRPGSVFSMENPAVTSPGPGSFLAERRLRIALGIAVVEGLLVVINVIPEWAVFVVAVGGDDLLVAVGPQGGLARRSARAAGSSRRRRSS